MFLFDVWGLWYSIININYNNIYYRCHCRCCYIECPNLFFSFLTFSFFNHIWCQISSSTFLSFPFYFNFFSLFMNISFISAQFHSLSFICIIISIPLLLITAHKGYIVAVGLGNTTATAAEEGCLRVLNELVKEVQVRTYMRLQ